VQNKDTIEKLVSCTRYSSIIKNLNLLISVFLDTGTMYNHTKDAQTIGASIQNMLPACCELGLDAVWLGEILNNKEQVNLILNVPKSLELMAIIVIGHNKKNNLTYSRKNLTEITFDEMYGNFWR
jgi:nitroreductase